MKYRNFTAIVFFLIVGCVVAGPPAWFISNEHDWVDPMTHIIGVGSGSSYEIAQERAGGDLAGQIEIKIEAESQTFLESYIVDDREQIVETFMSATKSFTSVSVRGAQVIDKAQDGGNYYVMLAISKDNFLRDLKGELEQKRSVIQKIRDDSQEMLNEGKVFEALELLMDTDELVAGLIARASLYNAFSQIPFGVEAMSGPAILSEVRKVLGKIKLGKVSGDRQLGKNGSMLTEPLIVRVYHGKDEIVMPNVRLRLKDEDRKTGERLYTDGDGEAEFWVEAIGDQKGKASISLDPRKIPPVFKSDLSDLEVTFSYEISESTPVSFTVKVVDKSGNRIEKVESIISKSVTKLGHHVSKDAPYWLTGTMGPVEANEVDGFYGTMYQVKTELDLFMKAKVSDESISSISITADGLDKKSAKEAIEKSYKNLKVDKKQMSKLLANASEKLDKLNAKVSKEEFEKGKASYEKGNFYEAMGHLTKVSTGEELKPARELILKIKNEYWQAVEKREKTERENQEAEIRLAEAKARELEAKARIEEAKVKMEKIKADLAKIERDKIKAETVITGSQEDVISSAIGQNSGYKSKSFQLNQTERFLLGEWVYIGAIDIVNWVEHYNGAGRILRLNGDHSLAEAGIYGIWEADMDNFFVNGFVVPYVVDGSKLIFGFNINGSPYMMVYLR